MLSRFFEIMGLSASKPLQSRADSHLAKPPTKGIHQEKPVAASSAAGLARRYDLKATTKKSLAVKKKPLAKVTSGKLAPKAKKMVTKAVAKTAVKPGAKSVKPVKKPATKRAAQVPVKSKTLAKPITKVAKKVPVSPPTKKQAAKKPTKTTKLKSVGKSTAKAPAKPASKLVPKTQSKVTPKTKSKTQAVVPKAVKSAPLAPDKKASLKPAKPADKKPITPRKAATPIVKTPVAAVPASSSVVATKSSKSSKSGLNSPANIAPLNVAVSTAAKTSFTMSAPVLSPPPPLVIKKDTKLVNNWKTKTAAELTDQEVIAMPDAEYMNDKQLAFFRLKLVQLKRDILSNAGETTEHLREDTSVVPDPADRATIEEEHALELRTRDRERKLLKKIEQSIVRIDVNDYGYCDETGEAIGVARLIARPTATLSIEAQQRRELKQKMFGD